MNLTCKGSFPEGSGRILVQFLRSFYVVILRQQQNQGNVMMAIFGGYQENLPNGGRMYLGNLGARIITAIRRRPRRLGAPAGDWNPIISASVLVPEGGLTNKTLPQTISSLTA